MAERMKVYVAGPMRIGDQARNIRNGIDAAQNLLELGFAPYLPHLTYFWDLIWPNELKEWLKLDFRFLSACDLLLRLPGASEGADREVDYARQLGIPVCHSPSEVLRERDKILASRRAVTP